MSREVSSVVRFSYQHPTFRVPKATERKQWVLSCANSRRHSFKKLHYIFCTDEFLHGLNKEYLQHDELTDIITFDLSDIESNEGEIYISVDRVRENAKSFRVLFKDELDRVIIHGALHLMGLKDKSPSEAAAMREAENASLSSRAF